MLIKDIDNKPTKEEKSHVKITYKFTSSEISACKISIRMLCMTNWHLWNKYFTLPISQNLFKSQLENVHQLCQCTRYAGGCCSFFLITLANIDNH